MTFYNIFHVAWFTFFQAMCSTLMALLIGLPAAFFCGRRKFLFRKVLMAFSVVPFCVPSLIVALGYVTFLGNNGGLNNLLKFVFGFKEPPVKILYSFAGLVIAHGFYNFPIIMKTVADCWEKLPVEQADNARLLGAGEFRVFRTVTIFQLMPSIASSSLLVFIYCFLSFVLVLLFGGVGNSTLEVEIYKSVKASLNFSQAGVYAIVETLILCVVTTFYCLLEQKSGRVKGISENFRNPCKKIKGAGEKSVFVILLFFVVLLFVSPLLGIVYNAFTSSKAGTGITLSSFERIFKMRSFLPSVRNTIFVGISTGLLCTILGFIYAMILRITENACKKSIVVLKIVPMLPMCISSVVLGALITLIVRRGNVISLVIAQSLISWPLAFRMIYPFLSKISGQTLDSARMLSKNTFDWILRVILPVSKKGLIAAFGFCFAVSAGDTTLPLVLAIPKFDNLSLFTYRLAGAYRFNEACASGVILGFLCIAVYLLSGKLGKDGFGQKIS